MHLLIRVNLTLDLDIGGTQSPSPTPILRLITEKIHSKYSHQDGLGYGPIFPYYCKCNFYTASMLKATSIGYFSLCIFFSHKFLPLRLKLLLQRARMTYACYNEGSSEY